MGSFELTVGPTEGRVRCLHFPARRLVNPVTEIERPNALDRVLQREWGLALA